MRTVPLAILLLVLANQAMAWWNTPYTYAPGRSGYWPNAWPAYVQPRSHTRPYSDNGAGWNVRGTMTRSGDAHFIMEYRGNIYGDLYGQGYSQPYYNGSPRYPNFGKGWR